MKKAVLILAILIFALAGCSQSKSTPPYTETYPPKISNLIISPGQIAKNYGNGSIQLSITIDASDTDMDFSKAFTYFQSVQTQFDISQYSGFEELGISLHLFSSTNTTGNFDLSIWVEDLAGNTSNILEGAFTVE